MFYPKFYKCHLYFFLFFFCERFNQAVRQSHVPGANMANAAAKADVIREEFEDASQKVENIKVEWLFITFIWIFFWYLQ